MRSARCIRDGIQTLFLRVLRSRCPVSPYDPRVCAIREKQAGDLERAVFIVRRGLNPCNT